MQGTELASQGKTEYKSIYDYTCTFLIQKQLNGEKDN